jgi:uncharacterized protein (DUF302 family)
MQPALQEDQGATMPTGGSEAMQDHAETAADDRGDVTTKVSPWSPAETVSRLLAVAAAREMKVFAVVDHSGEARTAGIELRDTKLVIFGSPLAGTPVMVAAPLAALDLPLKVLVWADGHQTKVSYLSPAAFARRYGLDGELAAGVAAIDALTSIVIDR